jgi:hypothetical protein
MFDTLLKPSKSFSDFREEVDRYLSTDTEAIDNVLLWWWEQCSMYPCLSRMALDYLSIPSSFFPYYISYYLSNFVSQATSVDVECVFSCGHLILSHVCSRLSAQSTRALLCIGNWSEHNFVKDVDVEVVAKMPDVQLQEGNEEEEPEEDGWDSILL